MPHKSFVPFLPHELGGAIVVFIFATLSTLTLLSVALRAVWLPIRRHLLLTATPKQEHIVFFNTHFGRYGACLLLAIALSTTGGIIGIFWLHRQGIAEGWVCNLQATLMQIATCGAAYFTVTIALHAFCSLVLGMRQSVIYCHSTMIIGWIIAISAGAIPFTIHLHHGHVYGANGLSCGVQPIYPKIQFFLHVLPMLIASFLSAVLYSLIFLALRGTLKIRGGIKLTLNPEARWNKYQENYLLARVAKSMLWYPVAYIALSAPYSIMLLLKISAFNVSFKAITFAYVCWFTLGVVIVLLLCNTFRILGSGLRPPSAKKRMVLVSRHLQNFECLGACTPSTSGNEITTLISSNRDEVNVSCASSPVHQDRSLTPHLSSPDFDYKHTITPPPSASLSPHPDMGRRGNRESPPLLAAGNSSPYQSYFTTVLPKPRQSVGIYGNAVPNSDHVIIFQQSTQTIGRMNDTQSSSVYYAT